MKIKLAKLFLVVLCFFFCWFGTKLEKAFFVSNQISGAAYEALATRASAQSRRGRVAKPAGYGAPSSIDLEDRSVNESSGLAASRVSNNLIWTHNDSGDGPFLYAFNERGKKLGVWKVAGARALDWEDLAAGPGPIKGASYLYVGDIGDNGRRREQIVVYRVREPIVKKTDSLSTREKPRVTFSAETIKLKYPDGKHDAEALLIHPVTGDLYIVSKKRENERANTVYKALAPLDTSGVTTLDKIADLRLPPSPPVIPFVGQITGGDISPDGSRIALCDYLQGFELTLPRAARNFDDIWDESIATVNLGLRRQGEAIGYAKDGRSLFATSEGEPCPLIKIERRR